MSIYDTYSGDPVFPIDSTYYEEEGDYLTLDNGLQGSPNAYFIASCEGISDIELDDPGYFTKVSVSECDDFYMKEMQEKLGPNLWALWISTYELTSFFESCYLREGDATIPADSVILDGRAWVKKVVH